MAKKKENSGKVRKSKDRPEQSYLPGTEPKRVKAIDELALTYRDIRDERQSLTDEEAKAKGRLLALMHEHSLLVYTIPDTDPPLEVVVETVGETVKVRKKKVDLPKRDTIKVGPDSGEGDEGFDDEE